MSNQKNKTYEQSSYEDFDQYERIKFKLPSLNIRKAQNILDLGCAKGQALYSILKLGFSGKYIGLDNDINMLDLGKRYFDENFVNVNHEFVNVDCLEYINLTNEKFDIILCWGLLSFYEDFELILNRCLESLSFIGQLSLWGGFIDNDFNVYVKYQRSKEALQPGLNMFGIENIAGFLREKGLNCKIEKFNFIQELTKDEKNPLKTWTETDASGQKFLINGLNIKRDFYHIIVSK